MTVLNDLRYAFRTLARGKMTTAVILLSLALGTGANATLYSVMDALLFRPPAGVASARQLAWVFTSQFTGALAWPDVVSGFPVNAAGRRRVCHAGRLRRFRARVGAMG